jgi:hypothetical protein
MNKKGVILIIIIVTIIISGGIYLYLDKRDVSVPMETGPEWSCNSDEDCWCRNFDGTEFVHSTSPSICCTEEKIESGPCSDSEANINHCAPCFYR